MPSELGDVRLVEWVFSDNLTHRERQVLNMDPFAIPFVCPDYYGPTGDVARCDMVDFSGEPAVHAVEQVPALAVGFGDMAASGTGSTGVARVNKLDRGADKPALVGDLGLEILEGPGVQDAPLAFPSRNPPAYPLEVFEGRDEDVSGLQDTR